MFERFLKKNLDLKILSLTISAFLWLFVHLTQSVQGIGRAEATLRIPLVVENLTPNLHVLEADRVVSITIKGDHRTLEGLKPSDFKASVDLEGKGAGAFRDLTIHVASPVGYLVTDIVPPKAEVVVDQEGEKTVPVTWEFEESKEATQIAVTPRDVVVKGSKSLVQRVVAVQIQIPRQGELPGAQQEYVPIPIDILSRPVAGVSVIPQTIRVIANPSGLAKPVPIRPRLTGKLPGNVELKSVSVNPPVVLIESGKSGKGIEYVDTSPIDLTGKQEDFIQTVKLQAPGGIKIQGKDEATVLVVIGKRG